MSSAISTAGLDVDKPEAGLGATTASIRANFVVIHQALTTAADEISAIQAAAAGYQPIDDNLTALAGLTGVADRLPYFTGAGTMALATFSSFGRTLAACADAAAGRTALGATAIGSTLFTAADAAAVRTALSLVVGTNVQAYDAELAAIAGLTSAADTAPYFTGSGAAALMAVTSFARTLLDDADAATARATLGVGAGADAQRNRIINANAAVTLDPDQGSTDNSYVADVHRLLLEASNAATYAQETSDLPTGAVTGHRLTVGSGNNNKFGVLFAMVANKDMSGLIAAAVSVGAQIKATSGIADVRIGIVQWTSTADGTTGDPISSWGSAGTNPTLASNWSFVNTPANVSPTTSWAEYKVENQTTSGSATNLGVIVWCDDKTTTQTTDILRIAKVRLVVGVTAVDVEPVAIVDDKLAVLERFRCYGGTATGESVGVAYAGSSTGGTALVQLEPPMLKIPTLAVSAAGDWTFTGSAATNLTGITISGNSSRLVALLNMTVSSGLTAGDCGQLKANTTAARLRLDARI